MCGHQLPFLSCLVPLYMVKIMCTWRQTLAVWPALVVGGGSFAVFQYFFATAAHWGPGMPVVWPMTDIGGGIFSLVTLALFLKSLEAEGRVAVPGRPGRGRADGGAGPPGRPAGRRGRGDGGGLFPTGVGDGRAPRSR